MIIPFNPVGSKEAVPFPLSEIPVPVHVPPASVGVPVNIIAEPLSHKGPYGPPVEIIGSGFTIISAVAGVFVHPVVGSVYE